MNVVKLDTGYFSEIGIASSAAAERWALHHGIDLALEGGYKKVIIESDSFIALTFIQKNLIQSLYSNLVCKIRELNSRN